MTGALRDPAGTRRAVRALRGLVSAAAVLALAAGGVSAQNADGTSGADRAGVAFVPFGPGERAEYEVTLGIFGEVGTGAMEVTGIRDVRGHRTYHLTFNLEGKVLVGSVDDRFQSWLDVEGLFARRFHKVQNEIGYHADKCFDFFPDRMTFERCGGSEPDPLASPEPLDDVSFLYYVRTLPLEPGDVYTLDRYYKDSGNPVVIKVLRREVMQGPNDTRVPVVVVQPIINTSGLFGEGGRAEVYFTDDWRRILVKMTSKVPVIGRLGLLLTGYTPGERLTSPDGP